ncbi:hypothetical protein [Streptomyces sp. NPDC005533]|uniref:hypothetical protein n=1 Tax=Streptomyces sp. NPDC005533 TaxID=3364723 RepID=UPI0036921A62
MRTHERSDATAGPAARPTGFLRQLPRLRARMVHGGTADLSEAARATHARLRGAEVPSLVTQ